MMKCENKNTGNRIKIEKQFKIFTFPTKSQMLRTFVYKRKRQRNKSKT